MKHHLQSNLFRFTRIEIFNKFIAVECWYIASLPWFESDIHSWTVDQYMSSLFADNINIFSNVNSLSTNRCEANVTTTINCPEDVLFKQSMGGWVSPSVTFFLYVR